VRFRQSGGFAGQLRGCELDAAELGEDVTRELSRLVARSGFDRSFQRRDPGARDAEVYELLIEQGSGQVHVQLDEPSLTEESAALIEFLQERSGPRGIGD